MLLGLPGRDRMNRDEVAEMLLPLAVEAVAVGWTAPKLRNHLARSCSVCAGQCVAGAGAGMSTATVRRGGCRLPICSNKV
jgi:hypothetical protein